MALCQLLPEGALPFAARAVPALASRTAQVTTATPRAAPRRTRAIAAATASDRIAILIATTHRSSTEPQPQAHHPATTMTRSPARRFTSICHTSQSWISERANLRAESLPDCPMQTRADSAMWVLGCSAFVSGLITERCRLGSKGAGPSITGGQARRCCRLPMGRVSWAGGGALSGDSRVFAIGWHSVVPWGKWRDCACGSGGPLGGWRGRALLRGFAPLDQVITGALLAMGGAVASQAPGIVSVATSARRRQHDAAARRAAEREARRRQLYEELLRTIDDALLQCAELSAACSRFDRADPALGDLAEGVPGRFDPLRTVAVAVMIDGSARASEIATTIATALRESAQAWKSMPSMTDAEGMDLVAASVTNLAALLGKAERELAGAARADFSVPD
jgi:hypothetical protein